MGDVFEAVVKAAKCLNGGEGGTILEIFGYIRENDCIKMKDKTLKCEIKKALKKGICKGCFKQNPCTKRYSIKCLKKCCPSEEEESEEESEDECDEEEEEEEEEECEESSSSSSSSSEEECPPKKKKC